MEGLLFGFFLGALAGGVAAVIILHVLKVRRDNAFNKLAVDHLHLPDPAPEEFPNLLSHNNLDWMRKGESA